MTATHNNTNTNEQKRILWIDDSPENMNDTLHLHIKELWKKDIRSDIFIFGNYDMKYNGYDEKILDVKVKALKESVFTEFIRFYLDNQCENVEIEHYWHLINKTDYSEAKESNAESDVVINRYSKLNNFMSKLKEKNQKTEDEIRELFDGINLSDYTHIVVDLCLTESEGKYKDKSYEKGFNGIDNNAKLPSMEIFHYLNNYKGVRTILYTSFLYANQFIKVWCDLYNNLYDNSNELVVYSRDGEAIYSSNGIENITQKPNLIHEILGSD